MYNNPAAVSVKLSCVFPPALRARFPDTDADGLMPLRRIPCWIAPRLLRGTLPAALTLSATLIAAPLAAQGLGRHLKAEANANLSFGNVDQSTILTRLGAGSVDSTLELTTDGFFTYGETRVDGIPTVNKRSWGGSLSANLRPFSQLTPFMLASIESSLEKRIVRRYSGGGGAKLTFVKRESTSSDLSLALLAERTITAPSDTERVEKVYARYSARYQLQRKVDDKLTFSLLTFYRPEFSALRRFTASANVATTYKLAKALGLKASFIDNYDSEARGRGARSNNDGDVLFGLVATF
jgi:hypothetical protein